MTRTQIQQGGRGGGGGAFTKIRQAADRFGRIPEKRGGAGFAGCIATTNRVMEDRSSFCDFDGDVLMKAKRYFRFLDRYSDAFASVAWKYVSDRGF